MSHATTRDNRSMPSATIIPVLSYPDVGAAVQWLKDAFGFDLRLRIGDHRAQLRFADGAVIIRKADSWNTPVDCRESVMVRVTEIERHLLRARAGGARIIQELQEFPYGERQYTCADLAGRAWTFSATVADIDPQVWGGQLDQTY